MQALHLLILDFFSRPYFLIKGHTFNDFCNSFQALWTFPSLIHFVFVFNISMHILFCRTFFHCGNSSKIKFLSGPNIFFYQIFYSLCLSKALFSLFGKASCPKSILESRVDMKNLLESVKKNCYQKVFGPFTV